MRIRVARPGSTVPSMWIGYWRRAELPLDRIGPDPCGLPSPVYDRGNNGHVGVVYEMTSEEAKPADSHLVAAQLRRPRSHQANPQSRFATRQRLAMLCRHGGQGMVGCLTGASNGAVTRSQHCRSERRHAATCQLVCRCTCSDGT